MAISGLFLTLYGTFRICIEFIRLPDNNQYVAFDWLTRGQILSLPMFVAGAIMLILVYMRSAPSEGKS